MNKLLLLPIVFTTCDQTDTPNYARLEFTEKHISRIVKLTALAEEHNITIEMDFDFADLLIDTVDEDLNSKMEKTDWRCDVEYLKIYPNGYCYFYAQNKWNAADQIESDVFTVEHILKSDL
jgi:hypothetical protein